MASPFAVFAKIVENSEIEPQEFIARVNRHIEALQVWEAHRATIEREAALRGMARPDRSECDSESVFLSALAFWNETQTILSELRPAPAEDIAVERAIEVHTAADGSRTHLRRK
jgi:hypothetical protein